MLLPDLNIKVVAMKKKDFLLRLNRGVYQAPQSVFHSIDMNCILNSSNVIDVELGDYDLDDEDEDDWE